MWEKSDCGRNLFRFRPRANYKLKHSFDTRLGEKIVTQLKTGYVRLNECMKSNLGQSNKCPGLPLPGNFQNQEVQDFQSSKFGSRLNKHEEINPKLPVFFCFKMFYGQFIKFGLHAWHLVS